MDSPQKVRLRRLNIRLSEQEWDKVHQLSSNTTCRSISEYARKLLLNKPVKVFYRNQSFDHFEEQMNCLLPQLEAHNDAIGQLVKKLSPLQQVSEITAALSRILSFELQYGQTAEAIKINIEKISDHETQNHAM
jgi:MobC-like protein